MNNLFCRWRDPDGWPDCVHPGNVNICTNSQVSSGTQQGRGAGAEIVQHDLGHHHPHYAFVRARPHSNLLSRYQFTLKNLIKIAPLFTSLTSKSLTHEDSGCIWSTLGFRNDPSFNWAMVGNLSRGNLGSTRYDFTVSIFLLRHCYSWLLFGICISETILQLLCYKI